MTVIWDDGHTSLYSFSLLRTGCQYAKCLGGHDKMSYEPAPEAFNMHLSDSPATRLKNLVLVGLYAITAVWEDGHDFSIYDWHYLRALCPCEGCRAENYPPCSDGG